MEKTVCLLKQYICLKHFIAWMQLSLNGNSEYALAEILSLFAAGLRQLLGIGLIRMPIFLPRHAGDYMLRGVPNVYGFLK